MKTFSYQRAKQFTGEIENCIGIKNELQSQMYSFDIYHPIISGVLMRGIFHTNAKNVLEIETNTVVIDGATSKQLLIN